jgi:hypothetical protein
MPCPQPQRIEFQRQEKSCQIYDIRDFHDTQRWKQYSEFLRKLILPGPTEPSPQFRGLRSLKLRIGSGRPIFNRTPKRLRRSSLPKKVHHASDVPWYGHVPEIQGPRSTYGFVEMETRQPGRPLRNSMSCLFILENSGMSKGLGDTLGGTTEYTVRCDGNHDQQKRS